MITSYLVGVVVPMHTLLSASPLFALSLSYLLCLTHTAPTCDVTTQHQLLTFNISKSKQNLHQKQVFLIVIPEKLARVSYERCVLHLPCWQLNSCLRNCLSLVNEEKLPQYKHQMFQMSKVRRPSDSDSVVSRICHIYSFRKALM